MNLDRDTFYTSAVFYGQDSQKKVDIKSCSGDPFDYKCQICKLEEELDMALGALESVTHYISKMYTEPYFGDTDKIDRFDVIIEAETDHIDYLRVLQIYHSFLEAFDSYIYIRKADFDKDLSEIIMIGNKNPVIWERYKISSTLGSRSSSYSLKKFSKQNFSHYLKFDLLIASTRVYVKQILQLATAY